MFAEKYARDVLSGKIVAGKFVHLAAKRFLNDLKRDDIYFDETEAERIIHFAHNHVCLWEDKWQGQPVAIQPWMGFILEQIYGWFVKDTGIRRVRKVYVEIAKKNAKSTLAGILANFHLFADERVRTPAIYVGANSEDQAKICVNITGKIIEYSPELYEYVQDGQVNLFNYKEKIVNVVHRERDGFIKAMPKEASNKTDATAGKQHGINVSLGIIDEYGMADSSALLSTYESAQAAREEPLIFCITTAGFKMDGPCYRELRRVGIDVLEGAVEFDSYLPFIYEIDEGDDIYNPQVWIKSNPNLGVSVYPEFLKQQLQKAKTEGSTTEVDVKTLNFNMWCEAAEVWIPDEKWAKNTHGISKDELLGATCFSGYDLSARHDICAVSLLFWEFTKRNLPIVQEDGSVLEMERWIHPILWWYWIPEAKVRQNKERIDYTEWVKAGYIHTVPGDTIEWEYLEQVIYDEFPKYQHYSGAYDRYLATNGLIQHLDAQGFTLHDIPQGFASISEPTKEFGTLAMNGQFEHFNNPVSRWMNKNTTIIRDSNRNIKIQKIDGNKGNLKIDGIAAAINAVAEAMSVEVQHSGIDLW